MQAAQRRKVPYLNNLSENHGREDRFTSTATSKTKASIGGPQETHLRGCWEHAIWLFGNSLCRQPKHHQRPTVEDQVDPNE